MPIRALDSAGGAIDPASLVVPILTQVSPGVYRVVGTAFYITRYGLLMTAKHVVDELVAPDGKSLLPALTWDFPDSASIRWRQITHAFVDSRAPREFPDIAVCQADNSGGKVMNGRIGFAPCLLAPGTRVATFAYPGNAILDFRDKAQPTPIFADVFEGEVLTYIQDGERPILRYAHIETTIEVRGGASGGPVFGPEGHAIAVNSRGWTFEGATTGEHLSSAIPITSAFGLGVSLDALPIPSWEAAQLPLAHGGGLHSLGELVAAGHASLHRV